MDLETPRLLSDCCGKYKYDSELSSRSSSLSTCTSGVFLLCYFFPFTSFPKLHPLFHKSANPLSLMTGCKATNRRHRRRKKTGRAKRTKRERAVRRKGERKSPERRGKRRKLSRRVFSRCPLIRLSILHGM